MAETPALTPEELDGQAIVELPDREAMTVIDLSSDLGGGPVLTEEPPAMLGGGPVQEPPAEPTGGPV